MLISVGEGEWCRRVSGHSSGGLLFFSDQWRVETAAVKLIIVFSVAGENSPSLPRSIYFYPILVPWVPEYLPAYLPVFLLHIYHQWSIIRSIIVLYWDCIAIKLGLFIIIHWTAVTSCVVPRLCRCWFYKQILYVNIRGKNTRQNKTCSVRCK